MDHQSLSNSSRLTAIKPLLNGWEDDKLAELLKMYTDKCSLETMAAHFQRTRGSISGAIYRARKKGLVNSVRFTVEKAAPASAPKPKPPVNPGTVALAQRLSKQRFKKQRVRLRLIDDQNQVTFAQLELHHCRWPLGDPRQLDFRFCGCTRVPGKPYCETHNIKAGKMYEGGPAPVRSDRNFYRAGSRYRGHSR